MTKKSKVNIPRKKGQLGNWGSELYLWPGREKKGAMEQVKKTDWTIPGAISFYAQKQDKEAARLQRGFQLEIRKRRIP